MKAMKQWVLISLLAGAWGVQGQAQGLMEGAGKPRPGAGMREGRMRGGADEAGFQDILRDPATVQALGLTEDQTEKIKALSSQAKTDLIDWNAKLQHAALALADLMGQEEPNEAAVMKALDETSQIRNDVAKLRIKQLFAVRAILTPEQRQKARELLQKKMSENRKPGDAQGGKRGERGPRQPTPPPDDKGGE